VKHFWFYWAANQAREQPENESEFCKKIAAHFPFAERRMLSSLTDGSVQQYEAILIRLDAETTPAGNVTRGTSVADTTRADAETTPAGDVTRGTSVADTTRADAETTPAGDVTRADAGRGHHSSRRRDDASRRRDEGDVGR
jgi:hypothetical protein